MAIVSTITAKKELCYLTFSFANAPYCVESVMSVRQNWPLSYHLFVDSGPREWRRSSDCSDCSNSSVSRQPSSNADGWKHWRGDRCSGDARSPTVRRRWATCLASTAPVRCPPRTQVSGWTTASHFYDHSTTDLTTQLCREPVQLHCQRSRRRRQSTALLINKLE